MCEGEALKLEKRQALGSVVPFQRRRLNRPKERRQHGRMLKTLGLPWFVMIGLAAAVIFMVEPAQISVATRSNAIVGRASVVDGDTLDIRRTRIRLHGIDAPERDQLCTVDGRLSRCGQRAALALAGKIRGHAVACAPQGRDRYDRVVAVCRVGEENLDAWMVAEGWAMAYRRSSWAYLPKEMVARWKKAGIWEGDVIPPWEWCRQSRR
jgi:endonuclease YncB( thermonuclease family)